MTIEEARKIAKVIQTADGWCPTCVQSLMDRMAYAFPDFSWTYVDGWEENPELDGVHVELKAQGG